MADTLDDGSNLWSQLGNAVALVAKQDQIVWTIYGIFWAANALLLVALFSTGNFPATQVGVLISIVGVAMSVIWFLIQWRANNYLTFFDSVARGLESELLGRERSQFALSGHLNEQLFKEKMGRSVSVRHLMTGSPAVCAILWFGGFLWFWFR